jgi:hypothetical protein
MYTGGEFVRVFSHAFSGLPKSKSGPLLDTYVCLFWTPPILVKLCETHRFFLYHITALWIFELYRNLKDIIIE